MKACPFCAETDLQDAAVVCKHCGKDLTTRTPTPRWVRVVVALSLWFVLSFVGLVTVIGLLAYATLSRAAFLRLLGQS